MGLVGLTKVWLSLTAQRWYCCRAVGGEKKRPWVRAARYVVRYIEPRGQSFSPEDLVSLAAGALFSAPDSLEDFSSLLGVRPIPDGERWSVA